MQNNSSVRVLTIGLLIFLGLLTGALFILILEGSGSKYIVGIGVIAAVVLIISFIRFYFIKQKKNSETSVAGGDGSEVGFVVDTFHDLVARLKEKEMELERLRAFAEEKAIRMEAYNENILQSVPSGVISVDTAMKIKSMNQAAERILGIDVHDVLDKRFDAVFDKPLTTLLQENKIVSRVEYPYVTNDSRHIWLGITTSQLKNTAGEKIGLIFVFTDLTDIKALQYQVELKQRLSQLGEMSAGIAHELRNSMSVISGYAKLVGKKVEVSSKPTVDAIQAEIRNMDRIISELLAFAKPTDLNTSWIKLHELVGETVEAMAGKNNDIKITVQGDHPVSVKADTVLLRQALSNLIKNAVDSMPDGGSLDIDLTREQNKAKISIRDTGCGISEEIMHKIFLPFYTTKEEGIGFGLALVQKIIVSHGGNIDVESKKGEGTTFFITLPGIG